MDFCSRYTRVAWARTGFNHDVLFTRLRCKQWDCDYCARKNQQIWRAFLLDRLKQVSDNWWFVTLTAHSRMRSEESSYKNLQHGIDVIMKRVRRVFGKVEYVRVFEKHPTSDALHTHLLVSNLTPFIVPGCNKNLQPTFCAVTVRQSRQGAWAIRTWLKKTAQECQIGYQAEVSQIPNAFAVQYVTKYLSKANQQITIKGIRHVQTSRGIGSPQAEGNLSWSVAAFATARDFNPGDTLFDLQRQLVVGSDYWGENDAYPPERDDMLAKD